MRRRTRALDIGAGVDAVHGRKRETLVDGMSFGVPVSSSAVGRPCRATPLGASGRVLVPAVVGEVLAGLLLGRSGFRWLQPNEPTISFLAEIGFAMLMFTAGMHVPLRQTALLRQLRRGALAASIAAGLAVGAGWFVSRVAHVGHPAIYAVVLASGSAAVVEIGGPRRVSAARGRESTRCCGSGRDRRRCEQRGGAARAPALPGLGLRCSESPSSRAAGRRSCSGCDGCMRVGGSGSFGCARSGAPGRSTCASCCLSSSPCAGSRCGPTRVS